MDKLWGGIRGWQLLLGTEGQGVGWAPELAMQGRSRLGDDCGHFIVEASGEYLRTGNHGKESGAGGMGFEVRKICVQVSFLLLPSQRVELAPQATGNTVSLHVNGVTANLSHGVVVNAKTKHAKLLAQCLVLHKQFRTTESRCKHTATTTSNRSGCSSPGCSRSGRCPGCSKSGRCPGCIFPI